MLQSYKHLQGRKHMKHVCFTEGAQEKGREKISLLPGRKDVHAPGADVEGNVRS